MGKDSSAPRAIQLLLEALELPPEKRGAFLDRACGQDLGLREELDRLLAGEKQADELFGPASTMDVPSAEGPSPAGEPGARAAGNAGSTPGRIGPYRLFEVIGEGGMGVVYRAEQEEPIRRRVAVKVIKLGMDTKEVVARFEQERQALALMDHPNIARVYDAGSTADGRPYFAMELVAGVPITDYCDRHLLTTEQRLELVSQVCDAVQHAHQKAVIHRDIKPSNVLVTLVGENPVPKIIDFGVAKATNQRLTEKTVYTEQGRLIGTPTYMSPEQAEMTGLDVDTRTDIYSLGVLLYELLVGVLPLEFQDLTREGYAGLQWVIREQEPLKPSTRLTRLGEKSQEVARKRLTDTTSLSRTIRGDLDVIVMKALAKDRTRRYQGASDLGQDIRRFLRHEPILARPPSAAYRLRKFARRNRVGVAVSATVLVVIGLTVVAMATWAQRRRHADRVSETRAIVAAASESAKRYRELDAEIDRLERQRREIADSIESWEPVWERRAEIENLEALRECRRKLEEHLSAAVYFYARALNQAPEAYGERPLIANALRDLYEQSSRWGHTLSFGPAFLAPVIRDFDAAAFAHVFARRSGPARVALSTVPPGAEVYCFAFVDCEMRRVPLPFRSGGGAGGDAGRVVGEPRLVVEQVVDEEVLAAQFSTDSSPDARFRMGDQLVEVKARKVTTQTELAGVLATVGPDEVAPVKLLRGGRSLEIAWRPFPAAFYRQGSAGKALWEKLGPSKVLHFGDQFGLRFEGYALEFLEENRVGTTSSEAPLRVSLPAGSYLFVFRQKGHVDVRYPVTVEAEDEVAPTVSLPRDDEAPPGFVYVPAGRFVHGMDPRAPDAVDGESTVPGFFIGRHEVTFGEYVEFLNDPILGPPVDREGEEYGFGDPLSPEVRAVLERAVPRRRLCYVASKQVRWSAESAKWRTEQPHWPAYGVPQLAALEYANWRTRTDPRGRRYRLPTDLEWERAARGTDRRSFVWGEHLVWSFCLSLRGDYRLVRRFGPPRVMRPVGASPLDESVFGVRDLAGSLREWTSDRTHPPFRYVSNRGGSWDSFDEFYFRVATRNGLYPESYSLEIGFRLVADVDRDATTEERRTK
jgi:serine/threonine protein kinase/formylglycine-generating enzyme required for sulfatase activity